MVFDLQRIAANQVIAHVEDGPLHRAAVFVVHGRTQARKASVGCDLEQEAAIGERRNVEAGYFHCSHALTRGWSRTSGLRMCSGWWPVMAASTCSMPLASRRMVDSTVMPALWLVQMMRG